MHRSEAWSLLLVDVDGSAGAPAIAQALARPQWQVSCADAQALGSAESPRLQGMQHLLVTGGAEAVVRCLQAGQPQWAGDQPRAVSVLSPEAPPAEWVALCAAGAGGWWSSQLLSQPEALAHAIAADRARWLRERQQTQLALRARAQLDDRIWVDRAKWVLMQARGIDEEQAFQLLRGAAMGLGQRMGDVSRAVLGAAQRAEAVNRAGQLRMLSQRLVKLGAQRLVGIDPRRARQSQGMAIARVGENLSFLASLPMLQADDAPGRPALQAVESAWHRLRERLDQRASASALAQADASADALLDAADALTDELETDGARASLHIINVCGRQRMRVQRIAKEALLAEALHEPARHARLPRLMDEVEASLLELERAPLTSRDIRDTLAAAREEWLRLLRGARGATTPEGRQALAVSSDALLEHFDRLTADYERSLQVLMA